MSRGGTAPCTAHRTDEQPRGAETLCAGRRAGFNVRGAVHRVWQGERSLRALQAGMDLGSQLVMQAIVAFALINDRQYGGKQTYTG